MDPFRKILSGVLRRLDSDVMIMTTSAWEHFAEHGASDGEIEAQVRTALTPLPHGWKGKGFTATWGGNATPEVSITLDSGATGSWSGSHLYAAARQVLGIPRRFD